MSKKKKDFLKLCLGHMNILTYLTELKYDKLDKRVRREYSKSENELFHCLKNIWNDLSCTFGAAVSLGVRNTFSGYL